MFLSLIFICTLHATQQVSSLDNKIKEKRKKDFFLPTCRHRLQRHARVMFVSQRGESAPVSPHAM